MKTYELSYIISPEITLEAAEQLSKEIETAVQSREGVILKQVNPIAKTLAYPIARRASGFFAVLEFQMEPEKLVEVIETIQKDSKIVRHMVIIKEAQRIRRERRSKVKTPPTFEIEHKAEVKTETVKKVEEPTEEKIVEEKDKEKVELKDIDQQLEELLG